MTGFYHRGKPGIRINLDKRAREVRNRGVYRQRSLHKQTSRFALEWGLSVNCIDGFLVSKETVVLRRWERSKQKFGFIKRVDKG